MHDPLSGYLLMTAIGLLHIQVILSVSLLLVLVAATVNTLLLEQDRRLRSPRWVQVRSRCRIAFSRLLQGVERGALSGAGDEVEGAQPPVEKDRAIELGRDQARVRRAVHLGAHSGRMRMVS